MAVSESGQAFIRVGGLAFRLSLPPLAALGP